MSNQIYTMPLIQTAPGQTPFEYLICYGGIGPNVWDSEMTVHEISIQRALALAIEKLNAEDNMRSDWWIFSIEQVD